MVRPKNDRPTTAIYDDHGSWFKRFYIGKTRVSQGYAFRSSREYITLDPIAKRAKTQGVSGYHQLPQGSEENYGVTAVKLLGQIPEDIHQVRGLIASQQETEAMHNYFGVCLTDNVVVVSLQ